MGYSAFTIMEVWAMTKMVASEIESLLRDYGYFLTVKDIVEDALSGDKVRSSILHAVNQHNNSVLIIRIRDDGFIRIRFTMPVRKGSLENIIWKLEDHGFSVDIIKDSIDIVKKVTSNDIIKSLKDLLAIISSL